MGVICASRAGVRLASANRHRRNIVPPPGGPTAGSGCFSLYLTPERVGREGCAGETAGWRRAILLQWKSAMPELDRITSNPEGMGGKPCLRGMRVTVGTVVGLVASGHSFDEILAAYP